MCGIVGIKGNQGVSTELYEGLIALQHRGQETAGIATYNRRFHLHKGVGLVRDVFSQESMETLKGSMGIGHVRYSTAGVGNAEEAQPFITHAPYGIALAHNGNIYNANELKQELFEKDLRLVDSGNDAEVIINILASSLERSRGGDFFDSLCNAVQEVFVRAKGGYSVVAVIAGRGLIAFRDPHGIRPLVWGTRRTSLLPEHLFASENTMFQFLGFDFVRDVANGEVVFVDEQGAVKTRTILQKAFRPCIFEYVYFARPDAMLNNVSVYRSRLRMGQNLAKKIRRVHPNLPIDVVIPAPSTATTAALSCARLLGVRYSEGLVKNQFIGRTFIMPGQETRVRANKFKLSVLESEVKGKHVLIVDDSIVRGSVSRHIVNLVRSYGATKVYLASSAPPLRFPDLYGIDLPTRSEYIAHNRTEDEIRDLIGADALIYQELPDLIEAVTRKGNVTFRPHTAYFDGDYPTEGVTNEVLRSIEEQRTRERSRHD